MNISSTRRSLASGRSTSPSSRASNPASSPTSQKALAKEKPHHLDQPQRVLRKVCRRLHLRLLDHDAGNSFLADFLPFQKKIAAESLQLPQPDPARLTAPGVPDAYQGSELWDFSLVVTPTTAGPSITNSANNTSADLRSRTGPRLDLIEDLLRTIEDGRIKLLMIQICLTLRRQHPDLFSQGDYTPLRVIGHRANHLFAFSRRHQGKEAIVLVPRFFTGISGESGGPPAGEQWGDTAVVPGDGPCDIVYTNAFTFEPPNPAVKTEVAYSRFKKQVNTFPWGLLIAE